MLCEKKKRTFKSRKKFSSGFFEQNNIFFVLYDFNDNIVAYFDNSNDLLENIKKINPKFKLKYLTYKFNTCFENFVYFEFLNSMFKLYYFNDDELENICI